jgi:hypothetical protein
MSAMLESDDPIEKFMPAINDLEERQKRIRAEFANLAEPVNVIALHPKAQAKYLRIVAIRERKLEAKRRTR